MKKRLLFAALFSAALVSCTKDQVVEVQQDEIKFRVATENTTKANNVFCNINPFESFNLSAYYKATAQSEAVTYITKDVYSVTKVDNTLKVQNTSGANYWPATGTLDFHAMVNEGATYAQDATTKDWQFKNFTPSTTVADQVDLMYATEVNKSKTTPAVTLNFRHALSQIVFNAKNENPNIYVEVYGVSVCNLVGTKTFTFPDGATSGNVVDHTQSGSENIGTTGIWSNETVGNVDYTVSFTSPVTLDLNASTLNTTSSVTASLTSENETNLEFSKKAMLLLPQTTSAWNPADASYNKPADAQQTGSYFILKCNIYNKKGDTYTAGDVLLYGSEAEGNKGDDIAIPFAASWEQGKKYVYTFVFTKYGNGGYDPDPETPTPVLTPIQLSVTIDDFIPGSTYTPEMNVPQTDN